MIQTALKYHKLGLKVIPTDLEKRPLCKWSQYRDAQTEEDIKNLFSESTKGIALITGNGIEAIDIDSKYFLPGIHEVSHVMDAIFDAVGEATYKKLTINITKSGGLHVVYITEVSEGNQKLASRYTLDSEKKNEHDNTRVLLETRGEGGYIIAPPTDGYSFDSSKYTFENLVKLSNQQRNALIAACRSFDEIEESYKQVKASLPIDVSGSGKSTIEAFNEAHTPLEFLEYEGWQPKYERGGNIHLVRPGKTLREGIGAGYNEKLGLVRIFTSSTQFEPNKSYNAFQVYSILNHGGDYSAACKELYHSGYGERLKKKSHKQKASEILDTDKTITPNGDNLDLMKSIYDNRIDVRVKPKQKANILSMWCEEKERYIGLGGRGDLINVFGGAKSRKSALASCMASTFLLGGRGESMLFKSEFQNENLLHFDTEQSKYYHHKLTEHMMYQAGFSQPYDNHPVNFYSFNIMPYTKIDRLNFIKYSINRTDNIGCVFIDGIVDLCRNYNDLEESSDLVTFFMNAASQRGFIIIDVLHHARSTGKARGHLGTELINKASCNIDVSKEKDSLYSNLQITDIRGDSAPKGYEFYHNEFGVLEIDGITNKPIF